MDWFGFGKILVALYVLQLVYQAYGFYAVSEIKLYSNRILSLQWFNRCFITGNLLLSNINMQAYFMSLAAANLTTAGMPSFAYMSKQIGTYTRSFNDLYEQLSRFVAELDCSRSDVLNYCEMLKPNSCRLI